MSVLVDKIRIVLTRITLFRNTSFDPDPLQKPSAQICTYEAGDVFELLIRHDQEITIDDLVENTVVTEVGIRVSNKQRTATTGQVIRMMPGLPSDRFQ